MQSFKTLFTESYKVFKHKIKGEKVDMDSLNSLIEKFKAYKKRGIIKDDITKYYGVTIDDFRKVIEKASEKTTKTQIKKKGEWDTDNLHPGAHLVRETDDFVLLQITNYEASRRYGSGTKWCIVANEDHWNQYYYVNEEDHEYGLTYPTSEDVYDIYYVLNKKLDKDNEYRKLAIVEGENGGVFDRDDNALNLTVPEALGYYVHDKPVEDFQFIINVSQDFSADKYIEKYKDNPNKLINLMANSDTVELSKKQIERVYDLIINSPKYAGSKKVNFIFNTLIYQKNGRKDEYNLDERKLSSDLVRLLGEMVQKEVWTSLDEEQKRRRLSNYFDTIHDDYKGELLKTLRKSLQLEEIDLAHALLENVRQTDFNEKKKIFKYIDVEKVRKQVLEYLKNWEKSFTKYTKYFIQNILTWNPSGNGIVFGKPMPYGANDIENIIDFLIFEPSGTSFTTWKRIPVYLDYLYHNDIKVSQEFYDGFLKLIQKNSGEDTKDIEDFWVNEYGKKFGFYQEPNPFQADEKKLWDNYRMILESENIKLDK